MYANHRCNQETDCTAAQVVLQDMLQMRSQESHLDYKVQEMPRQRNEAKEQNAGSQEVTKASLAFRQSHNILRFPLFEFKQT